jgi:chemotaxis protein MotB
MQPATETEGPRPRQTPAWYITFADLCVLLMSFFVLQLSFSELDVQKFKRLAGSMQEAFGVQSIIEAAAIPTGTSVIAREFAPGRPQPTPFDEVRQQTSDNAAERLDTACGDTGASNSGESGDAQKQLIIDRVKDLVGETERDAMQLARAVGDEVRSGQVEVETKGRNIVLRLRERGTFGSGSATLTTSFMPVVRALAAQLERTPGRITIEGHSDPVPIRNARFQSNWALSAARAASVAQALFDVAPLRQDRFTVAGHGDVRPLADNATAEGRARNRRVEVVIAQGLGEDVEREIEVLRRGAPAAFDALRDELRSRFGVDAGT